ncbi:MAG: hypothetical protein WKF68_09050 [Daejeonella sp.]
MHPISDKELDKLFQQRFEDAQFQPSEDVWQKIVGKMDQKKKVKASPVFWMAAASVVLVISAGLWFYRPVEVIRLQGVAQQMVESSSGTDNFSPLVESKASETVHSDVRDFNFPDAKVANVVSFESDTKPSSKLSKASKQTTEIIAANNSTKKNTQEVLQPRKEVKVPGRYTGDQSTLDVTQPDMIASADIPETDIQVVPEQSSPRKIRSIGSLVNFVISKVDHREDKIIEFKDGDEGSEVSGINLGVVKLKSRIK